VPKRKNAFFPVLPGLLALLALAPALAPAAATADPLLWPEAQRSFFQDGPGLLLTPGQRAELEGLDEAGRARFIESFLRDPVPSTPADELRDGIARRWRLATAEFMTLADARARLLFLNGAPEERFSVDCGTAFKPLEIWTYRGLDGSQQVDRSIVVYKPAPDQPFQPWTPGDSKRALYTPWMENWLEQWEQLGGRVRRFDLQVCKDARRVDRATAIPGLTGVRPTRRQRNEEPAKSRVYALRPGRNEGLLDPPGDLAAWARAAAVTPLPEAAAFKPLEGVQVELDYPALQGQRMLTRGLLTLPAASLGALQGEDAKIRKLVIEGLVEQENKPFEAFRLRYTVNVPENDATPVALSFEEPLRPGETFLMRLRVKDEGSGAEARLARGFAVPRLPAPSPTWNAAALPGVSATGEARPPAADSLVLLPPEGEVVLGLWRAEALVTGERIRRVTFKLDGKEILSRNRPPYTTEIRVGNAPAEMKVRAEGYDPGGALVASDEIVLNRPREAFEVKIVEPAEGVAVSGRTRVSVDVVVPEGRRVEKVELSVNDHPVATLDKAPYQAEVDIPEEEVVYVTAAATLDGGARLEDTRFVRAPDYMEKVDVKLIELYATVTDRSGNLVRGLTADDFEVLEGGQAQPITKFELVENLPLTVGITLDTSGSMESSLVEARQAAAGFVKNVLKPGDRAFALRFDSRPDLLVPPTDDVEAITEALDGLQAVGGTALHDALIASLHYFRATQGQRVLVLLSDGDDTASSAKFDDALEYARRSGVSIYTIGLNIPFSNVPVRNKLGNLAEATGGRTFYVSKAEELAGIYKQIEQEVRSRYLLAFQAGAGGPANTYRAVEVKSRKSGLKVRAARGYYP
jgi:VWFA-related protein